MPHHYNSNAFDEQNTEDAAGKPAKKKTAVETLKEKATGTWWGKFTRQKDQQRLEKLKKEYNY